MDASVAFHRRAQEETLKRKGSAPFDAKRAWKPSGRDANTVKPGDCGIWVTCHKNKERSCIGEMRDVLAEECAEAAKAISLETPMTVNAELPAGESAVPSEPTTSEAADDQDADDIESEIKQEVSNIRRPTVPQPFEAIHLDIPCVIFFRTKAPINPVELTHKIVRDAAADPSRKRTRCTMRLEPASMIGFAGEAELEQLAKDVLAPHFHVENQQPKKFAIRPTIRMHNKLKRDTIIKKVASLVGPGHSVDLQNYDALILVNVLKNIVSMSVVGPEFDRLKRFNLQEIFEPTLQPNADVRGKEPKPPQPQPTAVESPSVDAGTTKE